jgi:hypothetical protein
MKKTNTKDEDIHNRLKRRADEISRLIIATDYPAIDVAIQIRKLKEDVVSCFPAKRWLFELIYESRFRRLWEQFRPRDAEQLPDWD